MTLYIFDKDWTLVKPKKGKFVNKVGDQIPLPGVIEKCQELKRQDHKLAIASNQGGVAFGFMSEDESQAILMHAAKLIGADSAMSCPFHPEGTIPTYAIDSERRKPNPGMLLWLMKVNKCEHVVMVGDMETDKQAAENAGIKFIWAKDFFGFPDDYKDIE